VTYTNILAGLNFRHHTSIPMWLTHSMFCSWIDKRSLLLIVSWKLRLLNKGLLLTWTPIIHKWEPFLSSVHYFLLINNKLSPNLCPHFLIPLIPQSALSHNHNRTKCG